MAVYQFYAEQKVPVGIDEIWDFISSPKNLKKITPEYMGFDITTKHLAEKAYPGMIITYKVRPVLGIKITWVTEITHVMDNVYFVDEQRHGPYRMWHHEHKIFPIEGGTLMTDLVTYQPPFGLLGRIANSLSIRKKINEIFEYRRKALISIFGPFEK
mgnify:CR=1 FL=1